MSKRKKIRVEFRKNRGKRTRDNDLTQQFRGPASDPATDAVRSSERIRAKGDLSRHRTVIAEVQGAGETVADPVAARAVDLSQCELGLVTRVHGLNSSVEAADGRSVRCQIRRLLKTLATDERNVLAVGDKVWFRPNGPKEGYIEKVEARSGLITRGYRRREHVLVANVDQVLIVSAFEQPGLKLPLIDRYLIAAERGGVRPVIVLNKADLADMASYQWIIGLYTQLGYEVIASSAESGQGLDRLGTLLASGTTAISGQSGVGKSSLLNAIQPGLNLRVGEVSDWTFKGKHTTTNAELIKLARGGFVVDTPGLRQFELWGVEQGELEGHFVEFRPFIPHCRYPDCSHTHEDECAVKEAVEWGWIWSGRYASYLKLFHQQPLEGDKENL